jgi:hypothetical protein
MNSIEAIMKRNKETVCIGPNHYNPKDAIVSIHKRNPSYSIGSERRF